MEELAAIPKLPPLASHIWTYWRLLKSEQNPGPAGPARLTRAEIHTWEDDETCWLQRWELKAVMAVDGAWLKASSEALAKRMKK